MRLTVLGCSGGIGAGLRTTAMLLDDDVLIDAGTGVGDLSIEALSRIEAVFLTHSHLDHVCSVPFIADAVGRLRETPLKIYGLRQTLDTLRAHVFNNLLWPDLTQLPHPDRPFVQCCEIACGETVRVGQRAITPLPASHIVPAVGYQIDSGAASVVFTGDSGPDDDLWEAINAIGNLRYLIIETAFCQRDYDFAVVSQHLCPSLLADELAKLRVPAEVYITHLKPSDRAVTIIQVTDVAGRFLPKALREGQVFEF
ncbi:3',5'-cyclic-nucleotide phosphodiesterase [Paraburkholderia sp. 40]|uniref:3',5'-cyclic-nucleotide phosphodiesterase n=1 Tax=Paraburkholderia sp. 40 TaxID=2991059 RepID=UPI003D19FB5C